MISAFVVPRIENGDTVEPWFVGQPINPQANMGSHPNKS
jgi:hypothetical protein